MNIRNITLFFTLPFLFAACQKENTANQNTDTTTLNTAAPNDISILNVSYDPTRELYQAYNPIFQKYWLDKTGQNVDIKLSNGGSGKQSLAVLNGLKADILTLALSGDINAINSNNKELIKPDWQTSLPDNSTPYTSTIVFLVRKGNPKHIKDWDDLVKGDVEIITPNPKTSGGARWNFLAAWAYAEHQSNSSDETAKQFVKELYSRVPVMDTGARGSTISFSQRGLGDVLLAWENEAYLAVKQSNGELEIVTPSLSILCEPPVAVVDSIVDSKGTREVATEYLKQLYTEDSQRLIAQNFYRPINTKILEEFKDQFKELNLVTIDKEFGGWKNAQPKFFNDGGIFDQIYKK